MPPYAHAAIERLSRPVVDSVSVSIQAVHMRLFFVAIALCLFLALYYHPTPQQTRLIPLPRKDGQFAYLDVLRRSLVLSDVPLPAEPKPERKRRPKRMEWRCRLVPMEAVPEIEEAGDLV